MSTDLLDGLPVDALEALASNAPQIAAGVKTGMSAEDIVTALEPAAISALEYIAAIVFPGAGTAISIIAWVLEHSKKTKDWTPEETQRWFDKAQGSF